MPQGWIEQTVLGYLVPGLYLLLVNGVGMLLLAGLSVVRHWTAPWLTAVLGVGMILGMVHGSRSSSCRRRCCWGRGFFLAVGFALSFVALFWLRRTGQLQLW